MAFSAKQFSVFLLLLLTLLSSLQTHARDSQFFNKIPSTSTNNVVPINKETTPNNQEQQRQDPTFLPENENGYGLYGHESGQLPPSATTTTGEPTTTTTAATGTKQHVNKYLPKNYNPVAYVTVPENTNENSFTANPDNNNNKYYNGAENYYNNQQGEQEEEEEETEYRSNPTTTAAKNTNNFYYNGGSSFNSQPQGLSDTRFSTGAATYRYPNNGGGATFNSRAYGRDTSGFRPQPQGMSDTRFLEDGKYFYNVNSGRFSRTHPYESLKGVRNEYDNNVNNRNYYGNHYENVNGYEVNSENSINGGYQNQEEFQEEDINNAMP